MLATAAATAAVTEEKKDNKSDNYYPCAVVIKKIAKAIVVHSVSPFRRLSGKLSGDFSLDSIVCLIYKNVNTVQNVIYFFKKLDFFVIIVII